MAVNRLFSHDNLHYVRQAIDARLPAGIVQQLRGVESNVYVAVLGAIAFVAFTQVYLLVTGVSRLASTSTSRDSGSSTGGEKSLPALNGQWQKYSVSLRR